MGLGRTIDAIRRAKGMELNELAEKSDIPMSTLYRIIETDQNSVSTKTMDKICKGLDVTPRELLIENSLNTHELDKADMTYRFNVEMRGEYAEYKDDNLQNLRDLRQMMIRNLSELALISPIYVFRKISIEGIPETGTRRSK